MCGTVFSRVFPDPLHRIDQRDFSALLFGLASPLPSAGVVLWNPLKVPHLSPAHISVTGAATPVFTYTRHVLWYQNHQLSGFC